VWATAQLTTLRERLLKRRDPARVPRVPGLEERQGLPAPHLSDDDPIRAKAHRDPDQPGQIGHVACVELDGISRLALKLARVLEDRDPLCRSAQRDDLAHQGAGERRLARCRPTGDDDVPPLPNALAEHSRCTV
jgi:hypothetical protein